MSQHGIQNNFVCVNFELQISNLIHNRSQNSRKSKRRPTSRFLFFLKLKLIISGFAPRCFKFFDYFIAKNSQWQPIISCELINSLWNEQNLPLSRIAVHVSVQANDPFKPLILSTLIIQSLNRNNKLEGRKNILNDYQFLKVQHCNLFDQIIDFLLRKIYW